MFKVKIPSNDGRWLDQEEVRIDAIDHLKSVSLGRSREREISYSSVVAEMAEEEYIDVSLNGHIQKVKVLEYTGEVALDSQAHIDVSSEIEPSHKLYIMLSLRFFLPPEELELVEADLDRAFEYDVGKFGKTRAKFFLAVWTLRIIICKVLDVLPVVGSLRKLIGKLVQGRPDAS